MASPAAGLILLLVLGTVPPLPVDVRARIAGAVDDGDYQDDAFRALVENVNRWTPGLGDARIRLNPDLDRVLADPAGYRGELFRIVGILEQQSWLQTPHAAIAFYGAEPFTGEGVINFRPAVAQDEDFEPMEIAGEAVLVEVSDVLEFARILWQVRQGG